MRTVLLALLSIALTHASAGGTGPDSVPALRVTDLATEYGRFFDGTEGMEGGARVDAFKAHFATRFPGFYDAERVKSFVTPAGYDAMIARSFESFPGLRPRYERTTRSFTAMLDPARDAFVGAFPDFRPMNDIYLLHSLGEMDGGLRTIGGRRYLVFGADVMARLYAPGEERPFFHHELFHVYHAQFFEGCDAVWCALWSEGLAVRASEFLNPGATDASLLLEMPRPIRPEVEARRRDAVCAVRARLDSTSADDHAPLFTGRKEVDGLPPRFAYYVGYLVAREAGRTRSMTELARLRVEDARPVLDAALASLAICEAAPGTPG